MKDSGMADWTINSLMELLNLPKAGNGSVVSQDLPTCDVTVHHIGKTFLITLRVEKYPNAPHWVEW